MNKETKVVNDKVLAFGFISFVSIILIVVVTMSLFLFHATISLNEARETIVDQKDVMSSLRRSLDMTQGRLSVYEDFLVGTQSGSIRSLVRKYLLDEKVRSDETTLENFENWVYSKTHDGKPMGSQYYGVGGQ